MKDPIKELQMKLHKVIYKPVKKSDIPQQIPPFIDYDTIIKDMLKNLEDVLKSLKMMRRINYEIN